MQALRLATAAGASLLVLVGVDATGVQPVTDTALLLTAAGVAGLGSRRLTTYVSQPAALAAAALAGAALLQNALAAGGQPQLLTIPPAVGVGVVALAASIVGARPRWGTMAALTDPGDAGRVGRRLVAGALAGPAVVVSGSVALTRAAGAPQDAAGVALAGTVVLAAGAAGVVAGALRRAVARAEDAETRSRVLHESLREREPLQDALTADLAADIAAPGGWSVAVRSRPAYGQLAGDWVDTVVTRKGWHLVLVDVAGHGAGAALVASWCKHQLLAALHSGANPGEALAAVESLFEGAGQIATAVVARIDGGALELAAAGHPPVLVVSGGRVTELGATAPPLGVGTAGFPLHRHPVRPGDVVVAISDGVTEARRTGGDDWGGVALRRLAVARASEHPDDLAEAIVDAATSHAGGRLADDATVAVLRRN
jgi:hypothetical protein